jgi:hypothetical protein
LSFIAMALEASNAIEKSLARLGIPCRRWRCLGRETQH